MLGPETDRTYIPSDPCSCCWIFRRCQRTLADAEYASGWDESSVGAAVPVPTTAMTTVTTTTTTTTTAAVPTAGAAETGDDDDDDGAARVPYAMQRLHHLHRRS